MESDSTVFSSLWQHSNHSSNNTEYSTDDVYFANTNFHEFIALWNEDVNITNNTGAANSTLSRDFNLHDVLEPYGAFYESIHPYVGLTIGAFGVIANLVNIIVLTRRNATPQINVILTALAAADMMVLLNEILKIVFGSFLGKYCDSTYGCKLMYLVRMHLGSLLYFISVWLTVILAIWRFMSVCYPLPTERWRTMVRARTAVISTYLACIVNYIPYFLILTIKTTIKAGKGERYRIALNEFYFEHLTVFINLWSIVGTVILMLIPCLVVTILTIALVRTMATANDKRSSMKCANKNAINKIVSKRDERQHRTTKMLIVVLSLYLVTNLPRGLLLFLHHLPIDMPLFRNLHSIFDKILTCIILFNSAVNFIVYYSMCTQYRETFNAIFLARRKVKPNFTVALRHKIKVLTFVNKFKAGGKK